MVAPTTTQPPAEPPADTASTPDQPRLGRWRAAGLLSSLTGQQILPEDIEDFVDGEVLAWTGEYEGAPLVDVAALHALAAREDFVDLLDSHRLLTHNQAAARLGIRPTDLRYVIRAGWLSPQKTRTRRVGAIKTVDFPVYHPGHLAALLALPDVDWDAVRATLPGRPSPLRKYIQCPPTRSQLVRMFCQRQTRRHRTDVWPWWHNGADTWYIDWEPRNGAPTREQLARALARDKLLREHKHQIVFGSEPGMVVAWARAMLKPGVACVLDTETHDLHGRVCEIAVVDPVTREVLLNTLVNPGVPMEPGAQDVHGISDTDVADAPTFDQVWPQLVAAAGDRVVVAYNADYDRGVITRHAHAVGIDPGRLAKRSAWNCLMESRSAWMRTSRWLRLDGGHRALGDVLKACDVLTELTEPYKR